MSKAGIYLEVDKEKKRTKATKESADVNPQSTTKEKDKPTSYKGKTLKELEKMLQESIENEDYEKASLIRDEINKRKSN